MSDITPKVPKIITSKNVYAILSLFVLVAIASISYLTYKSYLVNSLVKKMFSAFTKMDEHKDMLEWDLIDRTEFDTRVAAAFKKNFSIKQLMNMNKITEEDLLEIFKTGTLSKAAQAKYE